MLPGLGISGIFPAISVAHTLENHISGNGLDLEKEKVLGNLTARKFPSANSLMCWINVLDFRSPQSRGKQAQSRHHQESQFPKN